MIGQILPNNNEKYYSNFSPKFSQLNAACIHVCLLNLSSWLWRSIPMELTSGICGISVEQRQPRLQSNNLMSPRQAGTASESKDRWIKGLFMVK
jgi:hypothetical protein